MVYVVKIKSEIKTEELNDFCYVNCKYYTQFIGPSELRIRPEMCF